MVASFVLVIILYIFATKLNIKYKTMSLKIEKGGKSLPLIPEGYQKAVITDVIDFGTQPSEQYGDKPQLCITWTFPEHTLEVDGVEMPRVKSKTFTASTHEKSNFAKLFGGVVDLGDGLNAKDLAGLTCEVMLVWEKNSQGNEYEQIAKIKKADVENAFKTVVFEIDGEESFKSEVFLGLKEWQQEAIKKSTEYNDVPF